MDQRARTVLKIGDKLFADKKEVNSLWQEIALNFYPERADFTSERGSGEEFADHLFSSVPVLARRELGNVIALFLYSRSQKRFSIHVDDEDLDGRDLERKWLEYITDIQWRAMYDQPAGFARATKQVAHDFASFGNAVIKYGLNTAGNGLLFRNYHLRDCTWTENGEGKIDVLHRNWKPTARQLKYNFKDKISADVRKACEQDPEKEFECRHVVMPSDFYDGDKSLKRFPYVSLYVERQSETILEEVGLAYFCYVVPRWATQANSPFGTSMATSLLLPDGRTMQAMIRTLREAGEKFVDPPMLQISDAIRGDVALYAGGITTADIEYDQDLQNVLRPVTQDRHGMPIGFELAEALKADITHGFFLDKIQLPDTSGDKTAFEIRRRIEEQIRSQAPIFDPIEEEMSPLYEGVFQLMRDAGAFPFDGIPESLLASDIRFKFRSPLADLQEASEAETFVDVRDRILGPVAQVDPAQLQNVNWTTATRDAMRAAGWKAEWFNPPEAVEAERQRMAQQTQLQETMGGIADAGAVAEQVGTGMKALEDLSGGEA